jgi:hypothetical protein
LEILREDGEEFLENQCKLLKMKSVAATKMEKKKRRQRK